MKPPTSVFDLGRMRPIALLGLYFELYPAAERGPGTPDPMTRAGTSHLIRAILARGGTR
jgi:hypothetical protein